MFGASIGCFETNACISRDSQQLASEITLGAVLKIHILNAYGYVSPSE